MRRILVLATVALVTAAMMVAMAMPALAAKPAPTREECLAVQRAINEGEANRPAAAIEKAVRELGRVRGGKRKVIARE
jgi:hypothetical protein